MQAVWKEKMQIWNQVEIHAVYCTTLFTKVEIVEKWEGSFKKKGHLPHINTTPLIVLSLFLENEPKKFWMISTPIIKSHIQLLYGPLDLDVAHLQTVLISYTCKGVVTLMINKLISFTLVELKEKN